MDCFKIEENKGLIRYLNVLPSQQAVEIDDNVSDEQIKAVISDLGYIVTSIK